MARGMYIVFLLVFLGQSAVKTIQHHDAQQARSRSASSSVKTRSSLSISCLVAASAERIENSAPEHAKAIT